METRNFNAGQKPKGFGDIIKNVKENIIMLALTLLFLSFLISLIAATGSTSNSVFNLTIWDDTDLVIKRSNWNTYFYANFTNLTNGNTISDGNCTIRFNYTGIWGSWGNMSYNSTYSRFQHNSTFNYKGQHFFGVNCSNATSSIAFTDYFYINNSIPTISKEDSAYWIDVDNNNQNHDTWQCTEDIVCYYNFSANVTDADSNDVLTHSFEASNTTITNYTLNELTGMLVINVTDSLNTGNGKKIELKVKDNDPDALWGSALLSVDIAEVNDAPYFVNLNNRTFNMSNVFEYIVNITDEENDLPFVVTIDFINCTTAGWSTRNSSNCTLFTTDQYSVDSATGELNISFSPSRNDVGEYIINFSVMDNSSLGNKTAFKVVNFSVVNVNVAPSFIYVCDDNRSGVEDTEFICWINATDIDEENNLTFSVNYTWFKFNATGSNSRTVNCSILTGHNVSAMINFTPSDLNVGNWSVNISVLDVGLGVGIPKSNSTIINFYINNVEDVVSMDSISNYSIYENMTFYFNATDDDLLVPDSIVKNELLTFASNTSWVAVSSDSTSANRTVAKVDIDYNYVFNNSGAGNYTIQINVSDTSGNYAERNFTVSVLGDNAADWNSSKQYSFEIYEGNITSLNLSEYASDIDGDSLNFTYTIDGAFSSFGLTKQGIISFTSIDEDVGYHNVTVNASDGKLDSLKNFNFTVLNVNTKPYIEIPISQGDLINGTVGPNSNINCTEDNVTSLAIWIQDDDYRVLQKGYYNESLTLNVTITGPNSSLINFVRQFGFPTPSGTNANKSYYIASFTPRKSDVGNYNISINVSDVGNKSNILNFNLTVFFLDHLPNITFIDNQSTSILRNLYYRINATDLEDGNSSTPGNYNFSFSYINLSGLDLFNSTTFNSTTGEINITPNASQGGIYHINVTVNDSGNLQGYQDLWIHIYDTPTIDYPGGAASFYLAENMTSNITFRVNHSVGDNLTYQFYTLISTNLSALKYNISYPGDSSNLTWQFTPNFTDETTNNTGNLTLVVFNPDYPELNATSLWDVYVNHTNAPVVFSGYIGDMQSDYSSGISLDLRGYFSDVDYDDSRYNQTLLFNVISNVTPSQISWSVTDWTLELSSLVAVTELLNITVSDTEVNASNDTKKLYNTTSNSFQVTFTAPTVTTVPTPSGGGSTVTPVAFKIITPKEISAYAFQQIKIPFELINKGNKAFQGINLTSIAFKDGDQANLVYTEIDKSYFNVLGVGDSENLTLTVYFDTNKTGDYQILVNATSKTPKYTDWAMVHINLQKINDSEIKKLLLFTEEFIAENPECAELNEIVEEAKEYFASGNYDMAKLKSEQAIDFCKESITQVSLPSLKLQSPFTINEYLVIATLSAIFLGVFYYSMKRRTFKRKLIPATAYPD